MKLTQITDTCYYFQSAVNVGYVHNGEKGLLIDAGLDASTMKKILKQLDEKSLPLTHLFITHAHADHFGGAAYLQEKKSVYTMAPVLEEAVLRNPVLEPIYLFQGNTPLKELRNKFLEGPAMKVDEVVTEGKYERDGFHFSCLAFPGHSENQHGLLIHDVLFCGDAYFGMEQLEKHKIPFIVDAENTLLSLEKLVEIKCLGAVPGHGHYEQDFQQTVQANIAFHMKIVKSMNSLLDERKISHEQLVTEMCNRWEVKLANMGSWLLYRTGVTAYLTMLIKQNKAQFVMENNIPMIKKGEG
ncbi:MBL fold metallo-hydrolase [Bacillus timonensis]|nr:MBL fold metallo-hydrolase [Bacillus timonensis]